jgi:polyisoprenoid-binding protein YceI
MSTTTTPRTELNLPAAGTYAIDASHSSVGFKVRHLMIGKTRGRFADFTADVVIAEEPTESSLAVEVQLASVDTREAGRDEHLRGADFFDVENFPTMSYRSTAVRHLKGDEWDVDGHLTVRGVTRPLTLHLEFEGNAKDPWGNDRAAFVASAEVDREDFGLTWNQALETGGLLVGKKVEIEIEAELIKQA